MMTLTRHLAATVFVLCLSIGHAHSAGIGDKAALQAAMQQHIDRSLVDGAYPYLDEKAGNIRALYPQKAHAMILRMGEYFVLCSDFRDENNMEVNIDFYLARSDDNDYVVFRAMVDDRALLRQWMRDGKAERLN